MLLYSKDLLISRCEMYLNCCFSSCLWKIYIFQPGKIWGHLLFPFPRRFFGHCHKLPFSACSLKMCGCSFSLSIVGYSLRIIWSKYLTYPLYIIMYKTFLKTSVFPSGGKGGFILNAAVSPFLLLMDGHFGLWHFNLLEIWSVWKVTVWQMVTKRHWEGVWYT